MTIVIIAAAALTAVTAYRRKTEQDPASAGQTMVSIRQSTSVVLALGEAVWAVLDALQLLFRRSTAGRPVPATAGAPARFGQQSAADVSSD